MKKYVLIVLSGLAGALLLGVLGVGVAMLSAPSTETQAVDEEGWAMGGSSARDEESLARVAGKFLAAFSWLPESTPEPDVGAQDAVAEAAPPPPPPPRWQFVGVLLEGAEEDQFALVAEAGRVNKYRVGDAFLDGTTLVRVNEQSMRILKAGKERDVFLYQQQ